MRAQPTSESSFELDTTLPPETGGEIGWKLLGPDGTYTTLAYDPNKRELFVDRTRSGNNGFSPQFSARTGAPLPALRGSLDLTILVDRSTLDVFAQRGQVAITNLFYPPKGAVAPEFFARVDWAGRIAVERWDLRSSWLPTRRR